jgi:putative ABC transport system substrate-binding protein
LLFDILSSPSDREANMRRREFIRLAAGSSVAWSFAVCAQQQTMPLVGFLNAASPGPVKSAAAAFGRGLGETGYVEGQNLAIEYRWAEGHYDRLPALAADLVARKVDLIVTTAGSLAALAAKDATRTIPIVFVTSADPVEAGLVASLARPGGNLTGVSILVIEQPTKRFELLSELVPQTRVIALLVNPTGTDSERITLGAKEAALAKGIRLHIVVASAEDQFETAFAALGKLKAGALITSNDPFFNSRPEQLVGLAARHAVPAIYEWREFAAAGGLISYGSSVADAYRQAGAYVGRILAGAKPADLPVVQPTKSELVINLKTAKALGLTVPQLLLAQADEVIE